MSVLDGGGVFGLAPRHGAPRVLLHRHLLEKLTQPVDDGEARQRTDDSRQGPGVRGPPPDHVGECRSGNACLRCEGLAVETALEDLSSETKGIQAMPGHGAIGWGLGQSPRLHLNGLGKRRARQKGLTRGRLDSMRSRGPGSSPRSKL
jgi:hypothetical protein